VFAKGSDLYLAKADGADAHKLITVSGIPTWIRFSPPTALAFESQFWQPMVA